jgi:hypothetical protein
MHIHIQALGGQWYACECGPLLVTLAGGSLGLLLGMRRILSNSDHRLLFLVARHQAQSKQQR